MSKTGYEQTPIEEVRRILREDHEIVDEKILGCTKKALVDYLLSIQKEAVETNDNIEEVFDEAKEDSDDIMQPYTEEEVGLTMPAYGSEGWSDYVMLQFRNDELDGDAPKCDGCRRVVEEMIGPIISTTLPVTYPPTTSNNGTATVSVSIQIQVTNELHPLKGHVISCEDIADVNKDNCDPPYYKHASATAATRAEGRALRKILRLRNVITAEEASERAETTDNDCDWQVDEPISGSQVSAITVMCKRLDIGVHEFINSGKNSYDDIHSINKSTGQRMIRELNKFQRKTKELPDLPAFKQGRQQTQNEKESD